ncbi:MAG: tetratricopeptide repeat protein [Bacillota bacterium]
MAVSANPLDIDSYWEYADPAKSEARFRGLLDAARGDERLELMTQVARTYSLRKRFDEAHRVLDEVEPQLAHAGVRPKLRYLLERGRAFNSAGEKDKARALFEQAWREAGGTPHEGLAVDAAHMVALTYSGTAQAIEWNERGLALARKSDDPKARALVAAMLNNMAWDLHDLGRLEESLAVFREAQAAWIARGQPRQIQVAKWSVAQALRALGRNDEALDIERKLEAEGFQP